MKNKPIKDALEHQGIKQWQLADALGVNETTLCKRLRHELPDEERDRILEIIERMRGNNHAE